MAIPLDAQFVDIPIFNQLVPGEGPKAIRAVCDFNGIDAFIIDLTVPMQRAIIKAVQTLYIDNADNPNDVVINTELSNQRIIFPRLSQGYIPLLLPVPGIFTINAPGGRTTLHMMNVPMPFGLWTITP